MPIVFNDSYNFVDEADSIVWELFLAFPKISVKQEVIENVFLSRNLSQPKKSLAIKSLGSDRKRKREGEIKIVCDRDRERKREREKKRERERERERSIGFTSPYKSTFSFFQFT